MNICNLLINMHFMYVILVHFIMHKQKHATRTKHILCMRFASRAIFITNRFNVYRPIIYFFITICIIGAGGGLRAQPRLVLP